MSRGMRLLALTGISFMAALVMFLSTQDTSATAPPFEPGGIWCLELIDSPAECDGDPSPGAASDVRNRFCIGWDATCATKDSPVVDSNFGPLVSFAPAAFNIPQGNTIPTGAIVGYLQAQATLGLLGANCSNTISISFSMLNGSIDINDTVAPKPVGQKDVMEPLAVDVSPQNGLPDGIDHYPSYLKEHFKSAQPRARLTGISRIQSTWVVLNFVFFDPGKTLEVAGSDITFKPELGYPSQTILQDPTAPAAAGAISDFCSPLLSSSVLLGVSKDNPCTGTAPSGVAGCPGAQFFENRGYPLLPCENGNTNDEDRDGKVNDGCPQINALAESGAQCDNDVSDDPEDSTVNDGCPQVGDVSEASRIPGGCGGGDEGGCTTRANPATPGTYTITMFANSQRDADSDGIENGFDVCFKDPNPTWNGRAADPVNDPDADSIPKPCDPDDTVKSPATSGQCPAGFTGPDQDQDCFTNRADNCPLVSQAEHPGEPPSETNKTNPVDTDSDGIGDACDPHPATGDGDFASQCMSYGIVIGAGASTDPVAPTVSKDSPACITALPVVPAPTATPVGQTPSPRPSGIGGTGGDVVTGVGSLAPVGTSVSEWAVVIALIGGLGVVTGLMVIGSRRARRRE